MLSFSSSSSHLLNVRAFSIDFEDTYDGLGDQLDEDNDDFNDDTFGGSSSGVQKPVGKDFDFFGSTAKVSNAISEEQMRYTIQQAPPRSMTSIAASLPANTAKPARSGYEKYQNIEHVSDLQVDPSLWGAAPQPTQSHSQSDAHRHAQPPSRSKKMLSLEEVEAQMRSQTAKPTTTHDDHASLAHSIQSHAPQLDPFAPSGDAPLYSRDSHKSSSRYPPTVPQAANQHHIPQAELPAPAARTPQVLQRPQQTTNPLADARGSTPTLHAAQKQARQRAPENRPPVSNQGQQRIPSIGPAGFPPQQIITHPQQLMQLSEEDRAAFLVEDAKRAKRNHKIFLLSKDNGLMTPQDKNFITRIQLQQLMTATGNTNDQDPNAVLSEDFYYQVHSQIRGGPRQNPHQPLNHFAQTYLFQTGGRHGVLNRRSNRGGDNHMQRMEQQVQRAVEAAKLKPKNKQLVIEGSLGKISFSNAKTPKPLLNIKRHEGGDAPNRQHGSGRAFGNRKDPTELTLSDRKNTLKNIEAIYTTLMKIEDDARMEPPPPTQEADAEAVQQHMEWRHGITILNDRLWRELKIVESIGQGPAASHPFISILSYPKGKKAVPRVFRHLSSEQRVTMLTMIVIHLDVLDVIRDGQLQRGETQLPAAAREAIDLFSAAVTPSLFSYVSEAPLFHVIGLLGLINTRVNVLGVARTRVGLGIFTMLTSRATLVKEAGGTDEQEWQQWTQCYNQLFDTLEPVLGGIFPGSVNSGEDMYVWQFLAAIGSGASPEQQQRLVIAVK